MSSKHEDGVSTLEKAKKIALEELDGNEENILETLPRSPNLALGKKTIESIEEKINLINSSSIQDNAISELSEIIEKVKADKVVIYTDKILNFSNELGQTIENILVKNLGQKTQNAFISDISENTKSDGSIDIEVSIGYSGIGSSNITLGINEIESSQNISSRSSAIFNDRPNLMILNIRPEEAKNYLIKINKFLHTDSIETDNFGYWKPTSKKDNVIHLISSPENQNLVLESLKKATSDKVEFINENQFGLNYIKSESLFDIFYKTKVPDYLKSNSLIILPIEDKTFLKINNPDKPLEITSWNQTSSLTKYINFKTLKIDRSLTFPQNSWSNGVITSNQGDILLFGVKDSKKMIVSGFELFPLDTVRKNSSDILLLNLLSEISKNKAFNKNSLNQQNLSNEAKCIVGEEGCNTEKIFPRKGIYLLGQGKDKESFVINNFNKEESESFNQITDSIVISNLDKNLIELSANINIPLFTYIAIILLLIDLFIVIKFRTELNWKVSKS